MSALRVLIVDGSSLVRRLIERELSTAPDLEVVGAAPDACVARELIATVPA